EVEMGRKLLRGLFTASSCIDNYKMVEEAMEDEFPIITCWVDESGYKDEIDLMLRKASFRIRQEGVFCTFGEMIHIVSILLNYLQRQSLNAALYISSAVNPDSLFYGNPEDDLISLLAYHFGMERHQINQWKAYSEHISEEALNMIAYHGVKEDFFKKFRSIKQNLIKPLIQKNTPIEDIRRQVSKAALKMLSLYAQNEKSKKREALKIESKSHLICDSDKQTSTFRFQESIDSFLKPNHRYSFETIASKLYSLGEYLQRANRNLDSMDKVDKLLNDILIELGDVNAFVTYSQLLQNWNNPIINGGKKWAN
ncbi:MAG: hypothetical protein ACP5I1_19360, partial [Candidatus Hinthialibacter sp.]